MEMLGKIGFAVVKWRSRRGLRGIAKTGVAADVKKEALRVGVNGETYAYWYLRSLGYVFIARNYEPSHAKGELDLVGFDGETLAFVEVRTRELADGKTALPEMSITRGKHKVLIRTAHYFLRERHIGECPMRFDVVAIDNAPGKLPLVRLHKDALMEGTRLSSGAKAHDLLIADVGTEAPTPVAKHVLPQHGKSWPRS